MKTLKFIIPTILFSILLTSCGDDDELPTVVNEEEVITSVIVNLTSSAGNVTLTSRDLDGDGPNPPVVVNGNLKSNTTYTGTIQFLNETETPAEDITEEVEEEAEEHQVFVIPGSSLNLTSVATNEDANGNPLGTQITITTTTASSGNLNVTLRHEPMKPNDGTLASAGGETDVSVNFDVVIED